MSDMGNPTSGAVEVCAICDIAGCHHIRERAAPQPVACPRCCGNGEITHPTDTAPLYTTPPDASAEVERLRGLLDHGLRECARETVRAEKAEAALLAERQSRQAMHRRAQAVEGKLSRTARFLNSILGYLRHQKTDFWLRSYLEAAARHARAGSGMAHSLSLDWTQREMGELRAERDAALARVAESNREIMDLREALNPPRSGPDAWCQPMDCGKHTPRVWMIRFEDQDVGDLTFDNEAEARLKFHRVNSNWNCYLMASLPLTPDALTPQPDAEMEALARHLNAVSVIANDVLNGRGLDEGDMLTLGSAISALRTRAALAQAQTGGVIKPLVWTSCLFAGQAAASADTEFGAWMVVAYSGRNGRWAHTDPAGEDSEDDWATRAECEAAAQADYEARIRSALTPQSKGGEA